MGLIMLSEELGVFMDTKAGIKKLEGFSKFDFNSGAQSYIRKYFSKKEKSVDVTESLPVIAYTFDMMKDNIVHQELGQVADQGLTGKDAVKEFVFVDFSGSDDGKFKALRQNFTIKCTKKCMDSGFVDYSGSLIAKGNLKKGYFVLSDDLKSGEFIPERSGILCD